MKKRNIVLLSLMSMALLTACGNTSTGQESSPTSEEIAEPLTKRSQILGGKQNGIKRYF